MPLWAANRELLLSCSDAREGNKLRVQQRSFSSLSEPVPFICYSFGLIPLVPLQQQVEKSQAHVAMNE
jgi:hypothetical protein